MTSPERIFITVLVIVSLVGIGWSIGWQFAQAPYAFDVEKGQP